MSDSNNRILKILAKVVSLVTGLVLLFYAFFYLGLWGCHDSGGFCAGEAQNGFILVSALFYIPGIVLIILAFTTKRDTIRTFATILLLLFAGLVLPDLFRQFLLLFDMAF